MTDTSSRSLPGGVVLAFVADVVALVVCLVATITDASPWVAFVVALCAFAGAGLIWFGLKRRGQFHPLATSAWALGLSALAWSIGLLAAAG